MFDSNKHIAAFLTLIQTVGAGVKDGIRFGRLYAGRPDLVFKHRNNLRRDTRAVSGAMGAVRLIVALMVGGLVAAFLLPVAIDEIVNVSTSSWSSGAQSMWDNLDLILVLAAFLFFIGIALSATDRL